MRSLKEIEFDLNHDTFHFNSLEHMRRNDSLLLIDIIYKLKKTLEFYAQENQCGLKESNGIDYVDFGTLAKNTIKDVWLDHTNVYPNHTETKGDLDL